MSILGERRKNVIIKQLGVETSVLKCFCYRLGELTVNILS